MEKQNTRLLIETEKNIADINEMLKEYREQRDLIIDKINYLYNVRETLKKTKRGLLQDE